MIRRFEYECAPDDCAHVATEVELGADKVVPTFHIGICPEPDSDSVVLLRGITFSQATNIVDKLTAAMSRQQ